MIHVLLIEDDLEIAKIIKYYLSQEDEYNVTVARNGSEAILASRDQIDIILLDIVLPDISGIDLCAQLREYHNCPIIFISCLDQNETIIDALEKGGDDYIVKPFDNKVLNARIKANMRRVNMEKISPSKSIIEANDFYLDTQKHSIYKDNVEYPLINIEYQILVYLMMNENKCYSAGELYKNIWGKPSYGDNRTVLVHIHNLRKKIEKDIKEPQYIKNIWGKGYLFDPCF